MNFYKHHIGDYAKKTSSLSLIEHGAYLLMMQAFYGSEEPLPPEKQELYRVAKAHTKMEKAAVDKVVAKFWKQTPAGLVNGRAIEEMKAASELAEVARRNGAKGGRPKKPSGLSAENPVGLENKTQAVIFPKAIQTPDSTSQTPLARKGKDRSAAKTPPTDPGWLPEFKNLYPKRGGDANWRGAVRAGNARIAQGHDPSEFLNGARRYAEFCKVTSKIGTEFVKQAATFLGPDKPFLEPWNPPATAADVRLAGNLDAAEDFMRRTEPKH